VSGKKILSHRPYGYWLVLWLVGTMVGTMVGQVFRKKNFKKIKKIKKIKKFYRKKLKKISKFSKKNFKKISKNPIAISWVGSGGCKRAGGVHGGVCKC
jgi:beta-lactamase regulating signal transducer with metallopeptidase domain